MTLSPRVVGFSVDGCCSGGPMSHPARLTTTLSPLSVQNVICKLPCWERAYARRPPTMPPKVAPLPIRAKRLRAE